MGKRREPRIEIKVPVRIFGTDAGGQIFSEKVSTLNVSQQGVEVAGVQAKPNVDEIVGLTYGATKVHFRVKWVGTPGTPKAGHLGLLNLSPEKSLWDFKLPPPSFDEAAQRRSPSQRPIEVRQLGGGLSVGRNRSHPYPYLRPQHRRMFPRDAQSTPERNANQNCAVG